MVQFNFNERTIKAKVVYYGPAQSGKTTNLEQIHSRSDPAGTSRLISLNTAQDRTLFFDLLPFSLGAVAGYDFKVQLYTIPGQVQYNATRRVVLAGADAVVFVADARKSLLKENQAAFENMKVNLLANRLVPEKMPLVLQYNKQDLPDILGEDELNRALNPWGRRVFSAVASAGQGVMETFVAVVQEMLTAIAVKYNLKEKGLDPAAVPGIVTEAFAEVLSGATPIQDILPTDDGFTLELVDDPGMTFIGSDTAAEAEALVEDPPDPPSARIVLSQFTDSLHAAPPLAAMDAGLVSEELLHRSIRSSVELAEALAGLVRDMNLGLGTILSHAELLLLYKDEAREKRGTAIAIIQQEATRLRALVHGLGNFRGGVRAAPPDRAPDDRPRRRELRGVPARGAGHRPGAPRRPADLGRPADSGRHPLPQLPSPHPASGAGRDFRGPGRHDHAPFAGFRALRAQAGPPSRSRGRGQEGFPDGRPRP